MSDLQPVLACDLSALNGEERTRRSTVAARVSAQFREVRDALDWVLLERRCCPFMRLELQFEPAPGPVWLRFGGGAGVKEFLKPLDPV